MTTEPDRIRAHIDSVLAELPDIGGADEVADTNLDETAQRLAEAHDVLLRALESTEKG